MAELYSQYTSGGQFTAGAIAGNSLGVSGINPLVDRLNSISQNDGVLSGTKYIAIHGATNNYDNISLTSGASTKILDGNTTRKSVLLFNDSASSIFIGASGVTYGTGYELAANDTLQLIDTGSIYGTTFSGTLNLRYLEIAT